MVYIGGIILMVLGILAYFMGKKGMAGLTEERGQTLAAVGVILGIILVLLGQFVF